MEKNIIIKNKRATYDFELVENYIAGIQLVGTEIKSIRNGKASLVDSFCFFINNELWLKNAMINEYFYGTYNNHEIRRDRKLLLTRKELTKMQRKVKESGLTIIPTQLLINEKGLAKVRISLAKGKKEYDKRETIKERDDKRMMARVMKK